MRRVTPLAAALALAVAGRSLAAQPTAQSTAQSTVLVGPADSVAHVWRGARSGLLDATRLVVRDAESWRRVWAALETGRADTLAPPPVDFRREIVVVAALGARVGAGHAIAIDTVRRADATLAAVVRTTSPGSSCAATFDVSAPADAVRVPRSERPVEFVEVRESAGCGGR